MPFYMLGYGKISAYLNLNLRIWPTDMNCIHKMKPETRRYDHIFIVSYHIFHQKSHQNTENQQILIFFISKNVSKKVVLVSNNQDLSTAINMSFWVSLITFTTQKLWFLMIFLDFCLFLLVFSKSWMIFVSQH